MNHAAWMVEDVGEPGHVMHLRQVLTPTPGPGEVQVRVGAVGLGYPDFLLCSGQYHDKPALPFVLGGEAAGEVVEVGPGVDSTLLGSLTIVAPGAQVVGLLSEIICVDANRLLPAPSGMTIAEAGGFFVGYQTAYMALRRRGAIQPGETALIFGAGGGVGLAAVQVARSLGARVVAVTSGTERAQAVVHSGAHYVIDRTSQDIVEEARRITDGLGVNVVIDPVGGTAFEQAQRVIAIEGRIVVVGFASGSIPAPAVNHLLLRNYSVGGFRTRPFRDDPDYRRRIHDHLAQWYEEGRLRPLVEAHPFAEAPEVVAKIGRGEVLGRAVCTI